MQKPTLALQQQPYLSGTNEVPYYEAHAKDAQGNDYRVRWAVKPGWEQFEDESDCCDWDVYTWLVG